MKKNILNYFASVVQQAYQIVRHILKVRIVCLCRRTITLEFGFDLKCAKFISDIWTFVIVTILLTHFKISIYIYIKKRHCLHFPNVRHFEDFCLRELLWARRLDFNVLSFLVHFERIGPRRSEKHLTGFFTLRWYPIAGKILNQWSKSLWTRIFEFG